MYCIAAYHLYSDKGKLNLFIISASGNLQKINNNNQSLVSKVNFIDKAHLTHQN